MPALLRVPVVHRLHAFDLLDSFRDFARRPSGVNLDALYAAQPRCQILRPVHGDNLSLVNDYHPLANHAHFRQDVRAQNQGMLAAEVLNQLPRLHHLNWVDADCRLVQHQHVRLMQYRLRDAHSLPKSLRQLAYVRRAVFLEPANLYDFVRPPAYVVRGHPTNLAHKPKILAHLHVRVQRHGLRQVANMPPGVQRLVHYIVSGDGRGAFGRRVESGDYLHRCGLARAVRPQEAQNLTLLDTERNIRNGREVSVVFANVFQFDHLLPPFIDAVWVAIPAPFYLFPREPYPYRVRIRECGHSECHISYNESIRRRLAYNLPATGTCRRIQLIQVCILSKPSMQFQ